MFNWNNNELVRHLQSENARLQAEVAAYKDQNQRLLDRILDASRGPAYGGSRYPDVPPFRAPLANKEVDLFEDIEEASENQDNRKEQYDSFQN